MPLKIRETEDAVIKVPDLMLLNKGTDRKLELRGGFNTDPKYCLARFVCGHKIINFFLSSSIHPLQMAD